MNNTNKEQILDFIEGNELDLMKEYVHQDGVIKNFLTYLIEEEHIRYNELYDFCYNKKRFGDEFLDFVKDNYKEAMDEFEAHCENQESEQDEEPDYDIHPEVSRNEK